MSAPLLGVSALNAAYGRARILFDVSLQVDAGEVVALIGRNGAGKSTTLRAILGLIGDRARRDPLRRPRHRPAGRPTRIARMGLGYVPEDRRIFTDLTVLENLEVGRQPPRRGAPAWTAERLFALFPQPGRAAPSRRRQMSGGEQQMLTVARTLMGNPRWCCSTSRPKAWRRRWSRRWPMPSPT